MKLKLLLFCVTIGHLMYSQNVINFNDKSYPSTDAFYFTQNASTHSYSSSRKYYEPITLSIGKNNKGGVILLQKDNLLKLVHDEGFNEELKIEAHLTGDLYIYLQDNSVIHCIDREIYGYIDDTSSVLYYLTNIEIDKLKKSTIVKIVYGLEAGIRETKKYSASAQDNDTTEAINILFNE
ncbi:hypothetical protein E0W68_06075 [Flavobacterium salilacus subsp. salilacus]|uniref:hypothetical protein n=1 Tax=Flavobacterium TaxID=237 RepID=UPI0010753EC4|nr:MULTISPECIES: hypothetical protein [Flavobacterium]KAF2518823.1 hypothetical protein E0W68_06075 [Flavobacterium salilacus subsp. salilacus]MBE1615020.1 hypothetical protein [Flavobacterium sp. SaA2.13]